MTDNVQHAVTVSQSDTATATVTPINDKVGTIDTESMFACLRIDIDACTKADTTRQSMEQSAAMHVMQLAPYLKTEDGGVLKLSTMHLDNKALSETRKILADNLYIKPSAPMVLQPNGKTRAQSQDPVYKTKVRQYNDRIRILTRALKVTGILVSNGVTVNQWDKTTKVFKVSNTLFQMDGWAILDKEQVLMNGKVSIAMSRKNKDGNTEINVIFASVGNLLSLHGKRKGADENSTTKTMSLKELQKQNIPMYVALAYIKDMLGDDSDDGYQDIDDFDPKSADVIKALYVRLDAIMTGREPEVVKDVGIQRVDATGRSVA